jgi:hypothetical protein
LYCASRFVEKIFPSSEGTFRKMGAAERATALDSPNAADCVCRVSDSLAAWQQLLLLFVRAEACNVLVNDQTSMLSVLLFSTPVVQTPPKHWCRIT